jgi:DNA polymerase zeta
MVYEIARVSTDVNTKFGKEDDPYGFKDTSAIVSSGRIFLNVWRLMRSELTLTSYTMESTVFHALHIRFVLV